MGTTWTEKLTTLAVVAALALAFGTDLGDVAVAILDRALCAVRPMVRPC